MVTKTPIIVSIGIPPIFALSELGRVSNRAFWRNGKTIAAKAGPKNAMVIIMTDIVKTVPKFVYKKIKTPKTVKAARRSVALTGLLNLSLTSANRVGITRSNAQAKMYRVGRKKFMKVIRNEVMMNVTAMTAIMRTLGYAAIDRRRFIVGVGPGYADVLSQRKDNA